MACFDGRYPIELPAGHLIGKHVLEGVGKRAAMPAATAAATSAAVAGLEQDYEDEQYAEGARDNVKPLVGSPGGVDALRRP
jgi:amidophosphoribosyltransferase